MPDLNEQSENKRIRYIKHPQVNGGSSLYGEYRDGSYMHINDAETGLNCLCKCISCGGQLIAKKGPEKTWHFSHRGAGKGGTGCGSGGETALHHIAKRAIEDAGYLYIPAEPSLEEPTDAYVIEVFKSFAKEKNFPNFKPDLTGYRNGRQVVGRILIEIQMTHAVDAVKTLKVQHADEAMVEINILSELKKHEAITEEEYREIVLRIAPRKWVHHPLSGRMEKERLAKNALERIRIDLEHREAQEMALLMEEAEFEYENRILEERREERLRYRTTLMEDALDRRCKFKNPSVFYEDQADMDVWVQILGDEVVDVGHDPGLFDVPDNFWRECALHLIAPWHPQFEQRWDKTRLHDLTNECVLDLERAGYIKPEFRSDLVRSPREVDQGFSCPYDAIMHFYQEIAYILCLEGSQIPEGDMRRRIMRLWSGRDQLEDYY
jgi:hypothetical protein